MRGAVRVGEDLEVVVVEDDLILRIVQTVAGVRNVGPDLRPKKKIPALKISPRVFGFRVTCADARLYENRANMEPQKGKKAFALSGRLFAF